MERRLRERLQAWRDRTSQHAKEKWWIWLLGATLEDRVMGWINATLDSLSPQFEWVATIKWTLLTFDSIGLGFIGNIFVLTILILTIHAYFETRSQSPHDPQLPEVPLVGDDTQDHIEQKHHFRMFVEQEMNKTCRCMQEMMNQVRGTLWQKGGMYHYFVRALTHFMEHLEEVHTDLTNLLASGAPLSNADFTTAQQRLGKLYRTYEERMCWVRDIGWYVTPKLLESSSYKNWKEADRNMRKELSNLLPACPVLSEQILHPNSTDPGWWEKTPPS